MRLTPRHHRPYPSSQSCRTFFSTGRVLRSKSTGPLRLRSLARSSRTRLPSSEPGRPMRPRSVAGRAGGEELRARGADGRKGRANGERVWEEVSVRWSGLRQNSGLRAQSATGSALESVEQQHRSCVSSLPGGRESPTVVGVQPRRRNRVLRVRSSRGALCSCTEMLRALVHAAPSDRELTRREPNSGFLRRSEHRSAAAIRRGVVAGAFAGAAQERGTYGRASPDVQSWALLPVGLSNVGQLRVPADRSRQIRGGYEQRGLSLFPFSCSRYCTVQEITTAGPVTMLRRIASTAARAVGLLSLPR